MSDGGKRFNLTMGSTGDIRIEMDAETAKALSDLRVGDLVTNIGGSFVPEELRPRLPPGSPNFGPDPRVAASDILDPTRPNAVQHERERLERERLERERLERERLERERRQKAELEAMRAEDLKTKQRLKANIDARRKAEAEQRDRKAAAEREAAAERAGLLRSQAESQEAESDRLRELAQTLPEEERAQAHREASTLDNSALFRREIAERMETAEDVRDWITAAAEASIQSANDERVFVRTSGYRENSRAHLAGGIDYRSKDLDPMARHREATDLSARLGPGFLVIVEEVDDEQIHHTTYNGGRVGRIRVWDRGNPPQTPRNGRVPGTNGTHTHIQPVPLVPIPKIKFPLS